MGICAGLLSMFDLAFIEKELAKAPYEPALGIRLARLQEAVIVGKKTVLVAVKIDAGKQLKPHVHEFDEEIVLPLTKGFLQLGQPQKNAQGEYEMDEDTVVVKWNEPQELQPGKTLQLQEAEAHFVYAAEDSDCIVLFFLPETHLGEDRKFVTFPQK